MPTREESEKLASIIRSTPMYFGLRDQPDEVFKIDTENCRCEGSYIWIAVQRFAYTTWKPHRLCDDRSFQRDVQELAASEYCGLEMSFQADKEYGTILVDYVHLIDDDHVFIEGVIKRGYRERAPFQDEGVCLDGERIVIHRADRKSMCTGNVLFVE